MIENQSILKERVKTLLEESLFCINSDDIFLHPAVMGDCVKSLIGTNLENPYEDLLDWLNSEIKKADKKEDLVSSQVPETQTTSYKQLQEALVSKDKQLITNILRRLNLLTDGTQLMEVLIEMSLHQTGKSFIPIWRTYKIVNFINLEDRLSCYELMCNFILQDDFRNDSFKDQKTVSETTSMYISNDYLSIAIYAHILDCKNHAFIRQDNLSSALNNMIGYISENKSENRIEIHGESTQKDRSSVLDKMRKNNLKLSKKNILVLDCIRMLIKNTPTINDEIIICMYQNLGDD